MYCPFISSKYCAKRCFSKTLHETAGKDNPENLRFGKPRLPTKRCGHCNFLESDNPPGISVSLQVEHKQFIGNGQLIGSSLR